MDYSTLSMSEIIKLIHSKKLSSYELTKFYIDRIKETADYNAVLEVFDDALEIADYFGVSFESCVFRLAYKLHAIDGDIEPDELRKRITKYKKLD